MSSERYEQSPAPERSAHADLLLADLDDAQRAAVTTESRLVAVIAGAGSGKTRVLTRRVAHRIVTGTADAAHTVVLTFTREAAGELRRRLPRLGLQERVVAGTFHAVCHQLLRQRWADTDKAPKTVLADRRRYIVEVAGEAHVDDMVQEIGFAAARGISADEYVQMARRGDRRAAVPPERVAETMVAFEQLKHRRGVLDLDDLLAHTIRLFERDQEFAATVRWRFRHVLVDEAQDLNPLQHRLVDLLRRGADDLFLVGDPAQAVYGFNGSDPSLLTDVSERFPGIEIIRLRDNHRCTPQIVDAGVHALRAGGQDTGVRSARPDGQALTVSAHEDERQEAAYVAGSIARLDPDLVRTGRVAVLARTHAALAATRARLALAGVPIRRVIDGAGSAHAPILADAYRLREAEAMRRWARDLFADVDSPADPAESGGLVRREIAEAALDFLREQPTGDGAAFRAWVTATDPFGGDQAGVELLTFHAAKGREWFAVHLIGCETSLVPHKSATTTVAKAEEARLLYVALTRATDVLHVHWAERRGGYQRKLTPLLEGFHSQTPDFLPPPTELLHLGRSDRAAAIDRLRAWRDGVAGAAGTVADAIVSDRVLATIAERRPTSADELDELTGIGTLTARRLYPGIDDALGRAE